MRKFDLIVIGGGPAGIIAAGIAAQNDISVLLLEKGPKLLRKLRITGKGRCNITNTAELEEFIQAFEPNGKFLYRALTTFSNNDLTQFLEGLKVPLKTERGGRVFPQSDNAGDIADALEIWAIEQNVHFLYKTKASELIVNDGKIESVKVSQDIISATAVIVAVGGASYPGTGSTGDGYNMAKQVGHTIAPIRPALSALYVKENLVREIQGLSLKNVTASLIPVNHPYKGKPLAEEFGEMLFTDRGLSGPIILTLSRNAIALMKNQTLAISIDLKPALSEEQLTNRFVREFAKTTHFKNYLHELIPRSMIPVIGRLSKIEPDKPLHQITAAERANLIQTIKDFRFTISGCAPLEEAIVTAGGVSLKEVEPRTMESKLVSGLFFAGEVLDIDAVTGGFNLQAAFSTGNLAGICASEYILNQKA